MHRGLLSMHAPLRSDNASRSNACGWHWITLVPTARLELAQLSPLPPQDSVSTNFTTSALSCNPGKQLLNCHESLQDSNYNRVNQFVQRTKSDPREKLFRNVRARTRRCNRCR